MKTAGGSDRGRHARHIGMFLPYLVQLIYGVTTWFPDLPEWVTAIITVVAVGCVWIVIQHSRELCDKCLGEMPLDPDKAVKRNMRPLWLIHHMKKPAIAMGVVFLASIALPKHWWETHVIADLLFAAVCYWMFAAMRHQRLQPWCPWCRDDGDDFFEEVPDPTDDKSKPIPA